MKRGGGMTKGTVFERAICLRLSLWVSRGTSKDLFWRSAISGGRATVLLQKGRKIKPLGDICSVDPAGHKLTDRYLIECKHWRSLEIPRFLLGAGRLSDFWNKCCEQALAHSRSPMLIARQDRYPTLLLVLPGALRRPMPIAEIGNATVYLLDDVLKTECKL